MFPSLEVQTIRYVLLQSRRRDYKTRQTKSGTQVLIDEGPNTLKRKIVSMYLSGYNLINLRAKSARIQPIQREAVREVVRRSLIGTEIIADSSDSNYHPSFINTTGIIS